MFLISTYKSKLWNDLDPGSRNLRIFILAGIVYIVLHSYLYSSYTNNMNFILNQRYLIYFLLITDLLLTFIEYITSSTPVSKIERLPIPVQLPTYSLPLPQKIMTRKPIQQKVKEIIKIPDKLKENVKTSVQEQKHVSEQVHESEKEKEIEIELTTNDFVNSETDSIPIYAQ